MTVKNKRYQGTIKPLTDNNPFYMVVVENSHMPPQVKHENYDDAFKEALRLSKRENKTAYVVISMTKVEQVSHVTQF